MRRHSPQTQQVLVALNTADESTGYEVMTLTGLSSGTVYPILARLEARGLVTSRVEEVGNRRILRVLYCLTPGGLRDAREAACVTLGTEVMDAYR
jgi:PadR family transcriptional regulator, regulatory protein PadR